jgi:hypothetical protein
MKVKNQYPSISINQEHLCPYCLSYFYIKDSPFRFSNDPNDILSEKYEEDPILREKFENKNQYPPVYLPSRDEAICIEINVKQGKNTYRLKDRLCPECHMMLPASFFQYHSIRVGIVGGRYTGKSSLLNIIKHDNNHYFTNLFGINSVAYHEDNRIYHINVDATRDTDINFFVVQINNEKNVLLTIYDMPGELLEAENCQTALEKHAKHLPFCHGLMFIVDLLQVPPLSQDEYVRNHIPSTRDQSIVIDQTIIYLKAHLLHRMPQQQACLCFSKKDIIEDLLNKNNEYPEVFEENNFEQNDLKVYEKLDQYHQKQVGFFSNYANNLINSITQNFYQPSYVFSVSTMTTEGIQKVKDLEYLFIWMMKLMKNSNTKKSTSRSLILSLLILLFLFGSMGLVYNEPTLFEKLKSVIPFFMPKEQENNPDTTINEIDQGIQNTLSFSVAQTLDEFKELGVYYSVHPVTDAQALLNLLNIKMNLVAESSDFRGNSIDKFLMSKQEITNGAYFACVQAKKCTFNEDDTDTKCTYHLLDQRVDYPMNCISLEQAKDFATWVKAELPTRELWQYAATSGGEFSKYPWGKTGLTCNKAIYEDCKKDHPASVCSLGQDSWSKDYICDLIGNVAEMDSTGAAWGGHYQSSQKNISALNKENIAAPSHLIGFRLISPIIKSK